MAVVAFESATDTSVHDGQRTSASSAAARCPAVGGAESSAPLPITSATTRTATGRATRSQSGRRCERSGTGCATLFRPRRLQEGVEIGLCGRAHEHGGDLAGGIDEERGGRARNPVPFRDGTTGVADGGPEITVLLQKCARGGCRVVEHHAHHVGSVGRLRLLVVEAGEVGGLLLARDAPAGEEVDHHVVAAQRGKRYPGARGEIGAGELRRLPAEQLALDSGGLLRRPGGEDDADHDQDEEDGARHPPGDMAPAAAHAAPAAPRATSAPTGSGAASRSRVGVCVGVAPVTRSDEADAGSVGRRRDPGIRASTPPTPMSSPPAHSQTTSGSMTTPMATDPCGRLLMAWLPDEAPSPPTASNVR